LNRFGLTQLSDMDKHWTDRRRNMAEENKQQVKPAERGGAAERGSAERSGAIARAMPARAIAPLDEVERMMDRMLGDFFPRSFLQPFGWRSPVAELEAQIPRVDVIDRDDQVILRAELPGVRKEDLDVAVNDSTVTVKANVQQEDEEKQGDYYRREIRRGVFVRSIALPTEVDGNNAKATFKDGVLELTLPKAEHARARHVPIQ
jgi:HSP20 family protein